MSTIKDKILEVAPNSKFPDEILSMPRVTAPNNAQLNLITQYNQALANEEWTTCQTIIEQNKDLENCRISAASFNKVVDEIRAIETYYNEEVDQFFTHAEELVADLSQQAVGISDSESSPFTTYSSAKIDEKIAGKIDFITIKASEWSSSAPYSVTKTVPGVKVTDYPIWGWNGEPSQAEYIAFCFITSLTTDENTYTFKCALNKPTTDIKVMIKRV